MNAMMYKLVILVSIFQCVNGVGQPRWIFEGDDFKFNCTNEDYTYDKVVVTSYCDFLFSNSTNKPCINARNCVNRDSIPKRIPEFTYEHLSSTKTRVTAKNISYDNFGAYSCYFGRNGNDINTCEMLSNDDYR